MLAGGPDDAEISCACDGHETFADRVYQAAVAAYEPRDGHPLDEGASLDSGWIGNERVRHRPLCRQACHGPVVALGRLPPARRSSNADAARDCASWSRCA